ncbi:MAG: delta-class carbonic anhydrase [Pseudomonadota bacterium]
MQSVKRNVLVGAAVGTALATSALAEDLVVDDKIIEEQRATLAASTTGAGFGPQAPRDIDELRGTNPRVFQPAPAYVDMHLCNIHFHEGAEHKGGEFTTYAGNGDGEGSGTGFLYNGSLTDAELEPYPWEVGAGQHGTLEVGDTIEVHYVHTTADINPGPTLGACLSKAILNPQLRVEAQVYVIVNDEGAADFVELNEVALRNGFHQAVNIPNNTGTPVQYPGSTTGPGYNEKGSPYQVTWSVRPQVIKVSIQSVDAWLGNNIFEERTAHGVRNLVINPSLLAAN